jgi:hypothetical protein
MNVIQQKLISERSGDCAETVDHEIQVVHCAPVNGVTVGAQLCGYGETTCEGTSAKASRHKLLDDVRGSPGVVGLEECGEHDQ